MQANAEPLRVLEKFIPKIAACELLMQVSYCGICGTDFHPTREGPCMIPYDTIIGYEFCGRIAKRGCAAWDSEFRMGYHIFALPVIGDEFIWFGLNSGGFGEYIRVSLEFFLKIPDGL